MDEVTPGNVIAPDNRRKSYLVYFAWLPLSLLRRDLLWLPVSVARHDSLQKLSGGLPRFFNHCLQRLQPTAFSACNPFWLDAESVTL